MTLASAVRAGELLLRSALWHEDRCAWIGPLVGYDGDDDDDTAPDGVIGPDLYAGTAGIAWFLACLYSSTRRKEFRRTAVAAMRHSILASDRIKRAQRCTFYLGTVGVAFSAVEIARRLDVPELESAARTRLAGLVERRRDGAGPDLLGGTAAAIPALLVLAHRLRDSRLADLAADLGDHTIAAAKRSEAGWSWRSTGGSRRNLTGFSHGAAGIGYAFVELFDVTRDPRYRKAAERAFDYERSWFDAERGNWPDFRGSSARSRAKPPFPFALAWCNGAPGIALSRIRAWELSCDPACRQEAHAAIRTTRAAIAAAVESDRGGFSLCHGLAGNAEVLYEARAFDDPADRKLIARAAREAGARARLRCPGSPGLFLGLAGIGYLNLRLHDRRLPSLLLVRRDDFL